MSEAHVSKCERPLPEGRNTPKDTPLDLLLHPEKNKEGLNLSATTIPAPTSWDELIKDRVLGSGTTGLVHLARSRQNPSKKYAVKSIVLDTLSEATRRYVENEVVTMKTLDHPNIIQFISSFKDSSPLSSALNACFTESLHIVMEYAPCGALAGAIESRVEIPDSVLLEWFVQLCSALYYLHSRRICHRDIKLQNIFLSRRHHVKLGDFGISTCFHTAHPVAETMVGTPLCFSPEQCEGLPYDEKCDVWALGVVLYQLCNGGKAPFTADNMLALVQQIVSDPTPSFQPPAPGKSVRDPRFEILCRAMLRKKASERPSVADILQNFVRLPSSHPSHPAQDPDRSRTLQKMCGPKEVLKQKHRGKNARENNQTENELAAQHTARVRCVPTRAANASANQHPSSRRKIETSPKESGWTAAIQKESLGAPPKGTPYSQGNKSDRFEMVVESPMKHMGISTPISPQTPGGGALSNDITGPFRPHHLDVPYHAASSNSLQHTPTDYSSGGEGSAHADDPIGKVHVHSHGSNFLHPDTTPKRVLSPPIQLTSPFQPRKSNVPTPNSCSKKMTTPSRTSGMGCSPLSGGRSATPRTIPLTVPASHQHLLTPIRGSGSRRPAVSTKLRLMDQDA